MCHISRKNVWRIIEKASLPRKSVRTRLKGRLSNLRARGERQLKERFSDFGRKGRTFPPDWRKMQQARIIPKTYQREQYPAF